MRMNGVLQTLIALPRTPSEAGLIESKTEKKKQIYKSCHCKELVSPDKIFRALRF